MIITNDEEREKLLADISFYNPEKKTYCLGNSFEEAAEIIREIMKDNPKYSEVLAKLEARDRNCGNGS